MAIDLYTGGVPSTANPDNFDEYADALMAWLTGTLAPQANTTATQVNTNATNAAASATSAATSATNAAASAAAALAGAAGLTSTSTTSNTIQTSAGVDVTFTVQSSESWAAGMPCKVARTADPAGTYFTADVKSYSGTTLVVTSDGGFAGTGTHTDWTITYDATGGLQAAVAADLWASSPSTTKAVTPDALIDAVDVQEITYGASLTWDVATKGYSVFTTLTGNVTSIGAPSILKDGMVYTLVLIQDATGGRTITGWNAVYEWGDAGTPSINTAASVVTFLSGMYLAGTGRIHMNHRRGA